MNHLAAAAAARPLPLGIKVDAGPGHLTITRQWRYAFATILCVMGWALAAGVAHLVARDESPTAYLAYVVSTALIAGYVPMAMLINRTTWRIENGFLDVRHGPLPWLPGRKQFDMRHVAHVRIEVRRRGDSWWDVLTVWGTDWGETSNDNRAYYVAAIVHPGRVVPVLRYSNFLVPQKHVLAICNAINEMLSASSTTTTQMSSFSSPSS